MQGIDRADADIWSKHRDAPRREGLEVTNEDASLCALIIIPGGRKCQLGSLIRSVLRDYRLQPAKLVPPHGAHRCLR